jgi:hypothetical protein
MLKWIIPATGVKKLKISKLQNTSIQILKLAQHIYTSSIEFLVPKVEK